MREVEELVQLTNMLQKLASDLRKWDYKDIEVLQEAVQEETPATEYVLQVIQKISDEKFAEMYYNK